MHRPRIPRLPTSLAALLALAACEIEPELDNEIQAVRGLDGVPPTGAVFSELAMTTGRLREVPYGYVNYDVATVTTGPYRGGYYVRVLATCYDGSQPRDACDPALVVLRGLGPTVEKVYSDQNADAGAVTAGVYSANPGAQTNPQNAMVTIYQPPSTTKNYWIATYSAARGTSKVNINLETRQTNQAPAWSTWAWFTPVFGEGSASIRIGRVVGGTLVNLGPVQAGDVLEARAHGNAGEAMQKLWVFNLARNKWGGVWGAGSLTFDGSWTSGTPSSWSTNYALVGFTALGQTGMAAEKYTELTLSPQSSRSWHFTSWGATCATAPSDTSRPGCADGNSFALGGGNYTFWVLARTAFPVGKVPDIAGQVRSAEWMGDHCIDDDGGNPTTLRGQGNDLAFRIDLEIDGTVVRSRFVPRGALGTDASVVDSYDAFSLDYRIPDDGLAHAARVHVRTLGPAVEVPGLVGWQRNLEALELKVATANLEYIHGTQSDHELRNAIRLLGGSAEYGAATATHVLFRANRSAWRWNADIIGFNEVKAGSAAVMFDHLTTRTPFGWRYGSYRQIEASAGPLGTDRYGPVYQKEEVTLPAGNHFETFDYDDDGFLAESSPGEYYAQPYRAAARFTRSDGSTEDVPVAVFNIYLPSGGNGPNQSELAQRKTARRAVVELIDRLSIDEPQAFSQWHPAVDPARFAENRRAIIMGDSNMMNHRCGEVNEFLEELRAEFGYAVDVSMAAVGSDKRTFDMHYNAMPLDYQGYGGWLAGTYNGSHRPVMFLDMYAWQETWDTWTRYQTGPTQRYPWWADNRSAEDGGDARYDIIILVGRGWAFDDPVRDYMTVPNLQYNPNIMTNFGGGAVDIRAWCDDDGAGDNRVPTSYGSAYVPDYLDVCPGYDGVDAGGRAVYRSDHKPIGARLRIAPRPTGTLF